MIPEERVHFLLGSYHPTNKTSFTTSDGNYCSCHDSTNADRECLQGFGERRNERGGGKHP